MRVIEMFRSLQGEGTLVGVPSVFVRFAGCPFRCCWCDTAYAWDYSAGEDLGLERIVEHAARWPCQFVVLTGGEPMVGPDRSPRAGLADLTHRLRALAASGKRRTPNRASASKIHVVENAGSSSSVRSSCSTPASYWPVFMRMAPKSWLMTVESGSSSSAFWIEASASCGRPLRASIFAYQWWAVA